jgi:hypothetical protein
VALRGDQQATRAPSTAPDRAHPTTYMIAAQESEWPQIATTKYEEFLAPGINIFKPQ